MNDKSQVGFVDAHAERIGRHDDFNVTRHETLLDLTALLRRQARMVERELSIDFFTKKLN